MTVFKYYRVYMNHTDIAVVSANDFNGSHLKDQEISTQCLNLHLPPADMMYYEYPGLILAMERAKSGALKYINSLLKQGEEGISRLLQYRSENYENLNINLTESNIRRIEKEITHIL